MILLVWFHLTQQRRATRKLRVQNKWCRKQFVQGVTQAAATANDRKDLKAFYKAVRQLNTKLVITKRSLHDPEIHLACGAVQEVSLFTSHYNKHYAASDLYPPTSVPLTTWKIDQSLLAEHLMESNHWKADPSYLG